jgi:hypothetical protein
MATARNRVSVIRGKREVPGFEEDRVRRYKKPARYAL